MIIPNLLILNKFSNMAHAELRKAEKAPMNGERTGRGERELRGQGEGSRRGSHVSPVPSNHVRLGACSQGKLKLGFCFPFGSIGHLHDGVILLLRPESFVSMLSCLN